MYSQEDLNEAYKDGFADGLAQGHREAQWHEEERDSL